MNSLTMRYPHAVSGMWLRARSEYRHFVCREVRP
ncbi:hypothetical protein FHT28_000177 [Rhizobium sp. SG570]|nr:hypothetical protein [Rhizobium sp. SG570]